MWLKSLQLTNIRSFADLGVTQFSRGINLLVGPNNSGKSTILRAIYLLQSPEKNERNSDALQAYFSENLRTGAEESEIELELAEPQKLYFTDAIQNQNFGMEHWNPRFRFSGPSKVLALVVKDDKFYIPPFPFLHQREPKNFIYPYFSRRKPGAFQITINPYNADTIEEVFEQLPSKIDRLANRDYPFHESFREICWKSLGLKISCAQWRAGKQAGLTLPDGSFVPVEHMGEGTVNLLVLVAHLCVASGKLFLMEEIENDIHPKALKTLLEFIIEKSETNQLIISTHSNIVTRYLGSVPKAKVFSVEMKLDQRTGVPTSTCQLVSENPADRVSLLESLGYEPFDFFMWKGYLILEESTAERLIRDFFIPFLVPGLQGKLRTIASHGDSDVETRLSDLLRLFTFVHLAPQYTQRAWVAVDSSPNGQKLVSGLKEKFKSWPEQHFRTFKAENFEEYYPTEFKENVEQVLSMSNGLERQKEKGKLAEEVLKWALADPMEAQKEFHASAKEVLGFLQEIAAKLT